MKRKTAAEVKHEIAELKRIQPLVRQRTVFGDDNRKAIGAIIRALEEEWDAEDAYDAFPTDRHEHQRGGALEAIEWRDGSGEESPSSGYSHLIEEAK